MKRKNADRAGKPPSALLRNPFSLELLETCSVTDLSVF
jgi:hypothetical protein